MRHLITMLVVSALNKVSRPALHLVKGIETALAVVHARPGGSRPGAKLNG